jgi:hypothetical protein
MKINPLDIQAFADYAEPLRNLERAFKKSGSIFTFYAWRHPESGKRVLIKAGRNVIKTVSIEGDSLIQAVKDVAQAVPL